MFKNYYIVLGIPGDSTQSEIKTAYRRLAKEFHPDYNSKGQSRFQKILEAYSVLSNPETRKSYDASLQPKRRNRNSSRFEPVDRSYNERVEPLIPEHEHESTWMDLEGRTPSGYNSTSSGRVESLIGGLRLPGFQNFPLHDTVVEIFLTRQQAQRGGNIRLHIPVRFPHISWCGFYSPYRESSLGGNGFEEFVIEKTIVLTYPPGITDNYVVRIAEDPLSDQQQYLTAIFRIR